MLIESAFGGGSAGFDGIEGVAAFGADHGRQQPGDVIATEKAVAVDIHRTGSGVEHRVPDDFDCRSGEVLVALGEDDGEGVAGFERVGDGFGADPSEVEAVDYLGGVGGRWGGGEDDWGRV